MNTALPDAIDSAGSFQLGAKERPVRKPLPPVAKNVLLNLLGLPAMGLISQAFHSTFGAFVAVSCVFAVLLVTTVIGAIRSFRGRAGYGSLARFMALAIFTLLMAAMAWMDVLAVTYLRLGSE